MKKINILNRISVILLLIVIHIPFSLCWGMNFDDTEIGKITKKVFSKQDIDDKEKIILNDVMQEILKKNFSDIDVNEKTILNATCDYFRKQKDKINKILFPDNSGDRVIIMGLTGAGKSSLVHWLTTGVKAVSYQDYGLVIEPINEENRAEVGHGYNSQTTIPVPHQATDCYYDCPGLSDTRGLIDTIENEFYMRKLFAPKTEQETTSPPSKIVIAITSSFLTDERGASFNKVLNQINNFFNKKEEHLKSVSLVITRSKGTTPDLFKSFLDGEKKGPWAKWFLNQDATRKIGYFPEPQTAGTFEYKEQREDVLKNIRQSSPTNFTVSSSLSDASNLAISNLAGLINENITSLITGRVRKQILTYCDNLIEKNDSVEGVRDNLGKFINNFPSYSESKSPYTDNDFLQDLFYGDKGIIGSWWVENQIFETDKELSETLHNNISSIKILKFIKSNINVITYLENWKEKLNKFKEHVTELNKIPALRLKDKSSDPTRIIEGFLIGTAEISAELSDLEEVSVRALHTVFFDKEIKQPGMKMTIMGPQWKVVGAKKEINLSGTEGVHPENVTAASGEHAPRTLNTGTDLNGASGKNGKPGNPGTSGGHFYGYYAEGKTDNLVINTNGGKGGAGQNGGNGGDGAKGTDGNKDNSTTTQQPPVVPKDLVSKVKSCIFNITYCDYNYECKGTPGGNGGNAGQGGAAGIGGNGGQSSVEKMDDSGQLSVISQLSSKGTDGSSGNPGSPGKKGSHGNTWRGVLRTDQGFNWKSLNLAGSAAVCVASIAAPFICPDLWTAPAWITPALVGINVTNVTRLAVGYAMASSTTKNWIKDYKVPKTSPALSNGTAPSGLNKVEQGQPSSIAGIQQEDEKTQYEDFSNKRGNNMFNIRKRKNTSNSDQVEKKQKTEHPNNSSSASQ